MRNVASVRIASMLSSVEESTFACQKCIAGSRLDGVRNALNLIYSTFMKGHFDTLSFKAGGASGNVVSVSQSSWSHRDVKVLVRAYSALMQLGAVY